MLAVILVVQAESSLFIPSISTKHKRQEPTSVKPFKWHMVRILILFSLHTSRMVLPASTSSFLSSILTGILAIVYFFYPFMEWEINELFYDLFFIFMPEMPQGT